MALSAEGPKNYVEKRLSGGGHELADKTLSK